MEWVGDGSIYCAAEMSREAQNVSEIPYKAYQTLHFRTEGLASASKLTSFMCLRTHGVEVLNPEDRGLSHLSPCAAILIVRHSCALAQHIMEHTSTSVSEKGFVAAENLNDMDADEALRLVGLERTRVYTDEEYDRVKRRLVRSSIMQSTRVDLSYLGLGDLSPLHGCIRFTISVCINQPVTL